MTARDVIRQGQPGGCLTTCLTFAAIALAAIPLHIAHLLDLRRGWYQR